MPYLEDSISQSEGCGEIVSTGLTDWPNEIGFSSFQEQLEPKTLRVSGSFPTYAAGTLVRTGPGGYKVTKDNGAETNLSHFFDGFSQLHKFDIAPGPEGDVEIKYRSRCQVDRLLERARATGRLEGITFAQRRDPCDSYFKKIKTAYQAASQKQSDPQMVNAGVVIVRTPGKSSSSSLTSLTDMNVLKEFDPNTLEPLGVAYQNVLHPDLKGPISCAHAAVDPATGEMFNYNLDFGAKPTYRVFKTNIDTGKTEILAKFAEKDIGPAYVHSFFITENYVVLCIWPAFFKNSGMSILWEQNIIDALHFDSSSLTNWVVIDRKNGHGVVQRFTSRAIFAFHFVNGWEEKSDDGTTNITCDLVEYENMDILSKLYYENIVSSGSGATKWTSAAKPSITPRLTRYYLPSIAHSSAQRTSQPFRHAQPAKIVKSLLAPDCGDLPRINENLVTKRHRYVYAVTSRSVTSYVDCIVKTDMEATEPTSSAVTWHRAKHSPGEPVFIPNPSGTSEDDGVILSVVLDGEQGTSYLLCLDARSMSEIAKAEVGAAVPFDLHGLYLPRS